MQPEALTFNKIFFRFLLFEFCSIKKNSLTLFTWDWFLTKTPSSLRLFQNVCYRFSTMTYDLVSWLLAKTFFKRNFLVLQNLYVFVMFTFAVHFVFCLNLWATTGSNLIYFTLIKFDLCYFIFFMHSKQSNIKIKQNSGIFQWILLRTICLARGHLWSTYTGKRSRKVWPNASINWFSRVTLLLKCLQGDSGVKYLVYLSACTIWMATKDKLSWKEIHLLKVSFDWKFLRNYSYKIATLTNLNGFQQKDNKLYFKKHNA